MKRNKTWPVVVFCIIALAWRFTAISQVPIIGSTITGTFGVFGNLVSGCNGCGQTTWSPSGFTQGSWIGYGQNGGSNTETDFINYFTTGAGGFSWFSTSASSLPSQLMNLNTAGLLMVNHVTAGFTGALTGNADTATHVAYSGLTGSVPTWNQSTIGTAAALTAAGTNCGSGQSAYGTDASGNALCNGTGTPFTQAITVTDTCTTAGTSYASCLVGTETWPSAFQAAPKISCTLGSVPTGVISSLEVTNKTTTNFQITILASTSFGTPATNGNIDCIGFGLRP